MQPPICYKCLLSVTPQLRDANLAGEESGVDERRIPVESRRAS
jgi:hypothetical protein